MPESCLELVCLGQPGYRTFEVNRERTAARSGKGLPGCVPGSAWCVFMPVLTTPNRFMLAGAGTLLPPEPTAPVLTDAKVRER
jgi:hypothetical protein